MGKRDRGSRPPKMVTEATFDVAARKDWLQGFSKRKRQRRMTGLAHGALKARKQKLADRATRRLMRPPPAPEPVLIHEPAARSVAVLDDVDVVRQWGAAVTVTTTVGGLDVDDEDAAEAEELLRGAAEPPAHKVDEAQVECGTLDFLRRKVSGQVGGRSAKAQRRSDRKRDANPHFKGGGRGAARSLLDSAAGKRGGGKGGKGKKK